MVRLDNISSPVGRVNDIATNGIQRLSKMEASSVFDVGGNEPDDRLQQLSESDLLLEAASELLQFVDGLVIKTDGADLEKPNDDTIAQPSHILDHNYASASPIPNAKKSNQIAANERRNETHKRVASYSHGRHRNGAVF